MNIEMIKKVSYIYLVLPIIAFCIGWMKWIFAIPISIALVIAVIFVNKSKGNNEKIISIRGLIVVFVAIVLVCILAGQGGIFYQSSDHHWRNAIFRDLINEKWPVYYQHSNSYLDYYIGHWLVPASIAKLFLPISQEIAFNIGNIILLLWSSIGVTLAFLWIVNLLKNKSKKNILIAFLIFVFFSGLDIIGVYLTKVNVWNSMHLEWWAIEYQFSSNLTQLFWVFNQAIETWLITMIFLNEKNVKNYLFLILLALPFAPLPFLGLIPLFACNGIVYLCKKIKEKEFKEFIKEVFSVQNVIGLICILPVYFFFYSINARTNSGQFPISTIPINIASIAKVLMFWGIEIGIYAIFICNRYKKVPLFWVSLVSLMFIPFFQFSNTKDLAMRASIPSLLVIMVFIIKYLTEISENKKEKIAKCIITILLIIGSVTPGIELTRAFKSIAEEKKIALVADSIITFSDKELEDYVNFMAYKNENSVFIKYLMK